MLKSSSRFEDSKIHVNHQNCHHLLWQCYREKPGVPLHYFQHWLGRWRWHWEKASPCFGNGDILQRIQEFQFFPFLKLYTQAYFHHHEFRKEIQTCQKTQQKGQICSALSWHCGFVNDNLKHILLLTMPSRKILLDELHTLNNFRLANWGQVGFVSVSFIKSWYKAFHTCICSSSQIKQYIQPGGIQMTIQGQKSCSA